MTKNNGDIELLWVVNKTTSSLFQLCMLTVLLATKRLAFQLSQALTAAVSLAFAVDSSRLFQLNPSDGFFVDKDGQKVLGASDHFFVSVEGKCVFPNRFNHSLEDSRGNPVDIDGLVKQSFFMVEMKLDLPDELRLVAKRAFGENVGRLMHRHTLWSNIEQPQASQASSEQTDAELALKPAQ